MNEPAADPAARATGRVRSLDGLRGVAALVVVFSHAFNASLSWYVPPGNPQPSGSLRWWISQTPLHIFWAGPEMVLVFFVLSGYVLAAPAVARGPAWFHPSYYPRRAIRLYLPALGAVLFAAAVHEIPAHSHPVATASAWLNSFAVPLTLGRGLEAASLTASQASLPAFTTVLWSMRWEVLFSALLPLLVLLPYFTRKRPALAALLALGCCVIVERMPPGAGWNSTPHYLAIFALGSVMAFHAHRLPAIPRRSVLVSTLAGAVCLVLLTAGYWSSHWDAGSVGGIPELAAVLGACVAVWLAVASARTAAALSSRVCQWLGHRSYSLYLVHQPIVISIAFAFAGKASLPIMLVTSVPASLLAADLFWRLVERPSIRLSHRVDSRPAAPFAPVVSQAAA